MLGLHEYLGLGAEDPLLEARELLLIVTGAEKAEALHEALEGPIGRTRRPRCCAGTRA